MSDIFTPTGSENSLLVRAILDDATSYTADVVSRNAEILKSIINGTEYTAEPQSEMEELLIRLKAKIESEPTVEALTVTENGTYSESGKSYSPVTVAVEGYTTATASGNPITLTDASALPLLECKASIVATQDLHGYSKPWVGGAGKNKLPLMLDTIKSLNTSGTWSGNVYTFRDVTFNVETNDGGNVTKITVNGTSSAWCTLTLAIYTPSIGNYILSNTSSVPNGQYLTMSDGGFVGGGTSSVNISITESASHTVYIGVDSGISVSDKVYEPMLRLSTETATTYEPYSNICPISGVSSIDLTHNDDTTTQALSNTCYGGSYDFASGGEIITHDFATLDETNNWIKRGDYLFRCTDITDIKVDDTAVTVQTNIFEGVNASGGSTDLEDLDNVATAINGCLWVKCTAITSLEDWLTFLASNNLQLAYEKETATSASNTAHQITPVAGTNTLEVNTSNLDITYLKSL